MALVPAARVKRVAAWAVSIGLLALGVMTLLTATSLLRPATNPISGAAPRFQASVIEGTLIAAALLLLSEIAARRWSAPAGGWKAGWFLIGALFLVLGLPLVLDAMQEETPLSRNTRGFRLGLGGLYVALGIASGAAAWASRRRPDRPV